MKNQQVVLKVTSITVRTAYSQTELSVEPVGDVLYALTIPEDGVEDGEIRIFNVKGIRHIVKGLKVALVIDVDDF